MPDELQQYLPVIIAIVGVIAAGLFVKKTGWVGIVLIGVLAAIWVFRSNPEWFAGLDGAMERLVQVNKR